jgi:hypothetical protein
MIFRLLGTQMACRSYPCVQRALGEIDLFSASRAFVRLVEFIRKNLFFASALRTFANKGLQVLVAFETRAMLWRGHDILLLQRAGPNTGLPDKFNRNGTRSTGAFKARRLFDSRIRRSTCTIWCITAVVQKLARLFAGRTLFRRSVSLQLISAITTLPTRHGDHLLLTCLPISVQVAIFPGRD